jgi:lysozyme
MNMIMNDEPVKVDGSTTPLNANLLSLARHAVTGGIAWAVARGWIGDQFTSTAFTDVLAVALAGAGARALGLAWAWLRRDKSLVFGSAMTSQQEGRALPDDPEHAAADAPVGAAVHPLLGVLSYTEKATANAYGGVNPAGMALIKEAEGLYLKAYRCPAGVWTIGWGHTGLKHQDGTVYAGRVITRETAEKLLSHDMTSFAREVSALVKVSLTRNQFSALVSFAFNVGLGAFTSSTLRRLLNAGDYAGAANQFERWTRGGGRILKGLVIRRAAEKRLFLTPGAIEFKPE